MGATAASLTADFVSQILFRSASVLDFGDIGQLSLEEYVADSVGIGGRFVGSLMNRSLLGFQTLYGKLPAWSPDDCDATRCLSASGCPMLGGGSNLIDTAEHARVGRGMLCLFVAKMLFTSTSFGSGALASFHADSCGRFVGRRHLR